MEKNKKQQNIKIYFPCFIYKQMENSDSKKFQIEFEQCISSATPVWEILNVSEEDFKKTYLKPFVIDAKGNQISIDVDNKNQEMKKT